MAKFKTGKGSISNILLATDLSCRCDRALARACKLAADWRSRLTIVTAIEQSFDIPSWRSKSAAATDAAKLEIGPELDAAGIDWDVFVAPGSPADVVIEACDRFQSDLIVTGVACDELFGRSRLGGTVEALLRRAKRPVLTVKRRALSPYCLAVVPTDFTEAAEIALVSAAAMFPQTRFVLLHGYRVPFAGFLNEEAHVEEFREEAVARQRMFLQRIRPQLQGFGVPEALIEFGSPERLIADYEDAQRPDLIVIGAHQPHDWLHDEVSGIAPKIIAAAQCDVLVVPDIVRR